MRRVVPQRTRAPAARSTWRTCLKKRSWPRSYKARSMAVTASMRATTSPGSRSAS